jgi:hypothetical protein
MQQIEHWILQNGRDTGGNIALWWLGTDAHNRISISFRMATARHAFDLLHVRISCSRLIACQVTVITDRAPWAQVMELKSRSETRRRGRGKGRRERGGDEESKGKGRRAVIAVIPKACLHDLVSFIRSA